MKEKGSGILLHVTSLPSVYGIGDLGPWAYRFGEFLSQGKQSFWQVLPLNPTELIQGNCPYSSTSAFAGNTLLLSPELLFREGLLNQDEMEPLPDFPRQRVDYHAVSDYKRRLFRFAYRRFRKGKTDGEYERFCAENVHWLDDFAGFITLKEHFGGRAWNQWPAEIRDREEKALAAGKSELAEKIDQEKFLQYLLFKQWFALKNVCNRNGIRIIGDMPIYVTYDSADVWANTGIFKLDAEKAPAGVAGVPPDYFSKTGQLWGNPVYDWEALKKTGYRWWIQRMEHILKLYDQVRIDHFRGLVAYWEVTAGEKTAAGGKWVQVPAEDFFLTLQKHFPLLPILAEDLGVITPDVKEIIRRFGFPGMKVLLFAFGEDKPDHPYLPHTYDKDCVVYTGTHDNNTVRGWFAREAGPAEKARLFKYLGKEVNEDEINWELIGLAMASVARTVIFPLPDVIGLGEEARMNRPGITEGNWEWRVLPEQLTDAFARKLKELTDASGRG